MRLALDWLNQRKMGLAILLVVASVIAGLVLNLVLFINQFDAYEPLEYFNPRIVSDRVVEQGAFIDVQFRWCNDDPKALITSNSIFQGEVIVPRPVAILDLPTGCHVETVRVNLPETVTPGHWLLGGSDRAVATDGRSQSLLWYTDSFEVVAANDTE